MKMVVGFPRKVTKKVAVGFMIFMAGLLFCLFFEDVFIWLYGRWTEDDSYYSHGFLIVPISAWLLWKKGGRKGKLSVNELEIAPIVGMLVSVLLHFSGMFFRVHFVSGLSMVLFFTFAGWFILGTTVFRQRLFPFLYLFLMIPVPSIILEKATVPMKIIVAKLSVSILSLANVPFLLKGFEIELPAGSLFIDNPCSGLRSFVAFLALGLLIVHIKGLGNWRGAVVLIGTLPVAVSSNVLRVKALLLSAHYLGIGSSQPGGVVHDWSGFPMFGLGLLLLFAISKAVSEKR